MSRWFDAYSGYKEKWVTQFDSAVDNVPALPGPVRSDRPMEFEAERVRPSRPPSIESDVLVPFGWAAVVGVLSFGVTLYFALANGFQWHLSCLVTMCMMALVFVVGIFGVQKTLWLVETISHIDLDRDGDVGQPSVEMSVSVKSDNDKHRKMYLADLGVSPEKLQNFARGISSGKKLTVSAWVGKNNLFSRNEFDRLMAELERLEMVERDGSGANAPRVLTIVGEQAISQLVQAEV